MTTYKIAWIEQKPTKDGKAKAEATLVGTGESDNATGVKVTIWGDFPDYANIQNGGTIEGDIVPSKDSKYLPSLKPAQSRFYGAPKASGGALEAAKVTAKSVDKALDRKEDSFKVSATHRDAVTFAVAEWQENRRLSTTYGKTLEELYQKWRQYFWECYDATDAHFPPKLG